MTITLRLFLTSLLITIGTLVFGQTAKKNLSEKAKIDHLISSIEKLEGAQFERNGTLYNAQKAAAHLRMKVDRAGSRVKTADDFIEKIASESSMTGNSYNIVFKDGRKITSRSYLQNQLKSLR